MTYAEHIREEMLWLSKRKKVVFIGEGVSNAGRIYGTLKSVPLKKCLEMPICENLIVGTAIGLAMMGYRPVVVFVRMDFMLIAADAIINHAALLSSMSGGKVTAPIILRAIIGAQGSKFDVGPQHKHDFRHIFQPYIRMENYCPGIYRGTYHERNPIMIVEEKDKYNATLS